MDSHQVEGQRRCTSARSKRLPWVKTAVGRALSPKGSFPARPRIRSLGQEETFAECEKGIDERQLPARQPSFIGNWSAANNRPVPTSSASGSGRAAMTAAIDLGSVRRPIALIRSSPEQTTACCGGEGKCFMNCFIGHGLLVANRALKSVGSNPPPGAVRAFSADGEKHLITFQFNRLSVWLPLLVGIGTICALGSIEPPKRLNVIPKPDYIPIHLI
jgi:hypothetical protein